MKNERTLEELDDLGKIEIKYHVEDGETVTGGRDEDVDENEDREINVDCFREELIDDDSEEEEDEYFPDDDDGYRGRDQKRRKRKEKRARKRAPRWDEFDPFEDDDWSWKP